MKTNRVYIDHILECLRWIEVYTADGRDAFLADRKTRSAVLREIQIMAESAQSLSPELKSNHPDVSWAGISGFRNVLVHDYLGIKPERVWEIIDRDLPVLRAAVEAMQREQHP